MRSNHLILSSPSPSTFNLSHHQGIFQWDNSSHQVAKYWSFSFSISPSNEYSGLISFRMDWLDLLAVQGTLKSLLKHHSSKASIQHSAYFIVQLSHPYMTTRKTIALTRRTFVGKVMSLLLNIPSRLVITFLPRSKGLLISWPQLPSAVILEPLKIKSANVSPSICHEVMGSDAIILVFWMLSFKPTFSLSSREKKITWNPSRFMVRESSNNFPMHVSLSVVPHSLKHHYYRQPVFSVHGILQARTVESVAIFSSRGSSWPRDWTQVFCISGRSFTSWATREALFAMVNGNLSNICSSSNRFQALKP